MANIFGDDNLLRGQRNLPPFGIQTDPGFNLSLNGSVLNISRNARRLGPNAVEDLAEQISSRLPQGIRINSSDATSRQVENSVQVRSPDNQTSETTQFLSAFPDTVPSTIGVFNLERRGGGIVVNSNSSRPPAVEIRNTAEVLVDLIPNSVQVSSRSASLRNQINRLRSEGRGLQSTPLTPEDLRAIAIANNINITTPSGNSDRRGLSNTRNALLQNARSTTGRTNAQVNSASNREYIEAVNSIFGGGVSTNTGFRNKVTDLTQMQIDLLRFNGVFDGINETIPGDRGRQYLENSPIDLSSDVVMQLTGVESDLSGTDSDSSIQREVEQSMIDDAIPESDISLASSGSESDSGIASVSLSASESDSSVESSFRESSSSSGSVSSGSDTDIAPIVTPATPIPSSASDSGSAQISGSESSRSTRSSDSIDPVVVPNISDEFSLPSGSESEPEGIGIPVSGSTSSEESISDSARTRNTDGELISSGEENVLRPPGPNRILNRGPTNIERRRDLDDIIRAYRIGLGMDNPENPEPRLLRLYGEIQNASLQYDALIRSPVDFVTDRATAFANERRDAFRLSELTVSDLTERNNQIRSYYNGNLPQRAQDAIRLNNRRIAAERRRRDPDLNPTIASTTADGFPFLRHERLEQTRERVRDGYFENFNQIDQQIRNLENQQRVSRGLPTFEEEEQRRAASELPAFGPRDSALSSQTDDDDISKYKGGGNSFLGINDQGVLELAPNAPDDEVIKNFAAEQNPIVATADAVIESRPPETEDELIQPSSLPIVLTELLTPVPRLSVDSVIIPGLDVIEPEPSLQASFELADRYDNFVSSIIPKILVNDNQESLQLTQEEAATFGNILSDMSNQIRMNIRQEIIRDLSVSARANRFSAVESSNEIEADLDSVRPFVPRTRSSIRRTDNIGPRRAASLDRRTPPPFSQNRGAISDGGERIVGSNRRRFTASDVELEPNLDPVRIGVSPNSSDLESERSTVDEEPTRTDTRRGPEPAPTIRRRPIIESDSDNMGSFSSDNISGFSSDNMGTVSSSISDNMGTVSSSISDNMGVDLSLFTTEEIERRVRQNGGVFADRERNRLANPNFGFGTDDELPLLNDRIPTAAEFARLGAINEFRRFGGRRPVELDSRGQDGLFSEIVRDDQSFLTAAEIVGASDNETFRGVPGFDDSYSSGSTVFETEERFNYLSGGDNPFAANNAVDANIQNIATPAESLLDIESELERIVDTTGSIINSGEESDIQQIRNAYISAASGDEAILNRVEVPPIDLSGSSATETELGRIGVQNNPVRDESVVASGGGEPPDDEDSLGGPASNSTPGPTAAEAERSRMRRAAVFRGVGAGLTAIARRLDNPPRRGTEDRFRPGSAFVDLAPVGGAIAGAVLGPEVTPVVTGATRVLGAGINFVQDLVNSAMDIQGESENIRDARRILGILVPRGQFRENRDELVSQGLVDRYYSTENLRNILSNGQIPRMWTVATIQSQEPEFLRIYTTALRNIMRTDLRARSQFANRQRVANRLNQQQNQNTIAQIGLRNRGGF